MTGEGVQGTGPSGGRERILRVAGAQCRERGAGAVTMRGLAEEVGVTATTLYRHFVNKDDVLTAVAEEGFALLVRYLDEVAAEEPVERLLAVLDAYLRFSLDEPALFDLMFLERRPAARRFPEDFAAGRSAAFNVALVEVEACLEAGRIAAADPLETTLGVWAYSHGLVTLYHSGRFSMERADFERLFRRSLERFVEGMAP